MNFIEDELAKLQKTTETLLTLNDLEMIGSVIAKSIVDSQMDKQLTENALDYLAKP